MMTTAAIINTQPSARHALNERTANPIQPKWSHTTEAIPMRPSSAVCAFPPPELKLPMRLLRVSLLLLLYTFTVPTKSTAALLPDSAPPREKAESFFNTIIQGDPAKALDTLLTGSAISTNKPEAAANLRRQLQTGLTVYGKPLGFDLVEEKNFGPGLVRLVYILRLEKYPLTWEFFFYGNGKTFLPIDVRFSDKLDVYRYDRLPTASDSPAS